MGTKGRSDTTFNLRGTQDWDSGVLMNMVNKESAKSANNKPNMAKNKTSMNWKKLFLFTAAVIGVGAAAAIYVKKMKESNQNFQGLIDDAVDFCKTKSKELESLISEPLS